MIWNPYNIYRAWKAGKRLYLVSKPYCLSRITWGPSLEQVQARFTKWTCRQLFKN